MSLDVYNLKYSNLCCKPGIHKPLSRNVNFIGNTQKITVNQRQKLKILFPFFTFSITTIRVKCIIVSRDGLCGCLNFFPPCFDSISSPKLPLKSQRCNSNLLDIKISHSPRKPDDLVTVGELSDLFSPPPSKQHEDGECFRLL